MFWLLIAILLPVVVFAAFLGCLHTRRLLSFFDDHLEKTREQLDQKFYQRRNLVPSFIALGAGLPDIGNECLEMLDNAAELVIRSKGFQERLVAENRLSSALSCLRKRLDARSKPLPDDLRNLLEELDDRETGITVSGDLYNRQLRILDDYFQKIPYRWTVSLCGYRSPPVVEISLSSTPASCRISEVTQKKQETNP